jgi:hypothetical protein
MLVLVLVRWRQCNTRWCVVADALEWHCGYSAVVVVAGASVRVCRSAVAECGRGAWARTHLAMAMVMVRPECEGDVHWALDSGRQCYCGAEMPLPVVCGSVSYECEWWRRVLVTGAL